MYAPRSWPVCFMSHQVFKLSASNDPGMNDTVLTTPPPVQATSITLLGCFEDVRTDRYATVSCCTARNCCRFCFNFVPNLTPLRQGLDCCLGDSIHTTPSDGGASRELLRFFATTGPSTPKPQRSKPMLPDRIMTQVDSSDAMTNQVRGR